MKKSIAVLLSTTCLVLFLTGCGADAGEKESVITIAAAASLKNCMDDHLIPMFREQYPDIKIQPTYDSSGKLQAQIEEGAPIDVFVSAAMKQMTQLEDKGLVARDTIFHLLENKIVLIVPANSRNGMSSFEDIITADSIAIGDPASVPAGQYAKEALTSLGIWDKVSSYASLGTNVTEVLIWVAEGSAEAGIVYSTDAASNKNVKVIAEAPLGSVSQIIYPVGIVKATKEMESAKKFVEFLKTDEALKVFESYGFKRME